jgi:hypothetical protein
VQAFNKETGYEYTRPSVPFEFIRPTSRATTTKRPVYNQPQKLPEPNNQVEVFLRPTTTRRPYQSTTFQPFNKEQGYDYSKPLVPFNFDSNNQVNTFVSPSTQRPYVSSTLQAFNNGQGYDYSKPSSTARPITTRRPEYRPVPSTTLQPFDQEKGYDYSKPSIPFNSDSNNQFNSFVRPNTQRPTIASTVQSFNQDTGYN